MTNKILYLLLFLSIRMAANSQHGMLLTADGEQNLLDEFTGVDAAYSLRELSESWEGQDVVLVRRDVDDAEQAFNANEILDGSLASYCSSSVACYVKTWYDQSGNGQDLTISGHTYQPIIYIIGSVVTLGGLPTLQNQTTNASTSLVESSFSGSSSSSIAVVGQFNTDGGTDKIMLRGDSNGEYIGVFQDGGTSTTLDNGIGGGTPSHYKNGSFFVQSGSTYDADYAWDNAVGEHFLYFITGDLSGWTNFKLAYGVSGFRAIDYMQEIIIWNTDRSSDRSSIEDAINSHYSIY